MAQAHAGSEWVGPWPPAPPVACRGIIQGLLPAKSRCRSSLECAGSLRCQGLGPTEAGVCGPPLVDGTICGGSGDPLATYARQDDIDVAHPNAPATATASAALRSCPVAARVCTARPAGRSATAPTAAASRAGFARVGQKCTGRWMRAGRDVLRWHVHRAPRRGAGLREGHAVRGACIRPAGSQEGTCRHDCTGGETTDVTTGRRTCAAGAAHAAAHAVEVGLALGPGLAGLAADPVHAAQALGAVVGRCRRLRPRRFPVLAAALMRSGRGGRTAGSSRTPRRASSPGRTDLRLLQ